MGLIYPYLLLYKVLILGTCHLDILWLREQGCEDRWFSNQKGSVIKILLETLLHSSGVPRNFVRGMGGSTNSFGDRGQRRRGAGGGSPLVRGSA
jgi:hypothetical protein